MGTTTYPPHVGGVANSVESTAANLRINGVRTIVLAPEAGGTDNYNDNFVIRVPALPINGFFATVYSRPTVRAAIRQLKPHILHSHHPFLIGDPFLFAHRDWKIPLIFTWHTRYEHYAHHFTGETVSKDIGNAALAKAITYAAQCSAVIAPSTDIQKMIYSYVKNNNVAVIPTGISTLSFKPISPRPQKRVVGIVSRLTKEKNLLWLADALPTNIVVLIVGDGADRKEFLQRLSKRGIKHHYVGVLKGAQLVQAYNKMDLFVFASLTETQGMVVAESALCGTPVVALDAPGVRDVINPDNGYLVPQNKEIFKNIVEMALRKKWDISRVCASTSSFSMDCTIKRLIRLYKSLS